MHSGKMGEGNRGEAEAKRNAPSDNAQSPSLLTPEERHAKDIQARREFYSSLLYGDGKHLQDRIKESERKEVELQKKREKDRDREEAVKRARKEQESREEQQKQSSDGIAELIQERVPQNPESTLEAPREINWGLYANAVVKGHFDRHQLLITFNAECLAFEKKQRDAKKLRTAEDGSAPSLENDENDVMTATFQKKGELEERMVETPKATSMEGVLDEVHVEPPSLVADDDRNESPPPPPPPPEHEQDMHGSLVADDDRNNSPSPPHPPPPEHDEDNVRAASPRDSEVLASFQGTPAAVSEAVEAQRVAETVVHITAYKHLRPSWPCENCDNVSFDTIQSILSQEPEILVLADSFSYELHSAHDDSEDEREASVFGSGMTFADRMRLAHLRETAACLLKAVYDGDQASRYIEVDYDFLCSNILIENVMIQLFHRTRRYRDASFIRK